MPSRSKSDHITLNVCKKYLVKFEKKHFVVHTKKQYLFDFYSIKPWSISITSGIVRLS